jgi:hypothetical protein
MPVVHRQPLSVVEYHRLPVVRQRIREYCGETPGGAMTCAFLSAYAANGGRHAVWEDAPQYPPEALDALLDQGADIARSTWDYASLLVHLDLDYQNVDFPGEPFLHPAEVFFKLEPLYTATRDILAAHSLALVPLMTGRGYHFTGRVPIDDPLVTRLADLSDSEPPWLSGCAARRPIWTRAAIDARRARAYTGLGMVLEYLAHLIVRRSAAAALIPVVLNGTVVGPGLVGRECASVDLSHAGDPLDIRQMRTAFSAYQFHRLRRDVVGPHVAGEVPALAVVPRDSESVFEMLQAGRSTDRAAELAESCSTPIPEATSGLSRLLDAYLTSRLAAFHRDFYAAAARPPREWRAADDRLDLKTLLPCVAAPLATPNDLLLQPARVQHVTRALMSLGWSPRDIAGLVHSRYARDYQWGTRWTRMDPQTRAEFDVRVFAGMLVAGLDDAVDFNCRSAQEKGLCPAAGCDHDLRSDRDRLLIQLRESRVPSPPERGRGLGEGGRLGDV